MNAAQRTELFRRLRAANPAPTTELEYASTFQLLIAVILSAQATDKSVNLATRRLFADAPTPQAMLALGEDGLAQYINRIGLYRNKAKNVIATCARLLEQHGGEVPHDREALEALPARRPTWDSTQPLAKRRSPSTRTFFVWPTACAWRRAKPRSPSKKPF